SIWCCKARLSRPVQPPTTTLAILTLAGISPSSETKVASNSIAGRMRLSPLPLVSADDMLEPARYRQQPAVGAAFPHEHRADGQRARAVARYRDGRQVEEIPDRRVPEAKQIDAAGLRGI